MVTRYEQLEQSKPRFRDHRSFWLCFAALVLMGLLLAVLVYVTAGVEHAALVLSAEGSLALAAGMR